MDEACEWPREGAEEERRIEALLAEMTLEEKVAQMSGSSGWLDLLIMPFRYNHRPFASGQNERLGIEALRFTDGPRGVAVGQSTCFPVPMARGATFDRDLEERIGAAIGRETRARGANVIASVCINVLRHPGWGRAQETYGEDPYHLGEMGVAAVRGVQRYAMACIKHFACNSIEESRFKVSVQIDDRSLYEVYLPHFKKCVDAGAAMVMSAYNRINREYCGHHRRLLREILKNEWGFRGPVMSDFVFGIYDTEKGCLAGLDIEMPFTHRYGRKLVRAVRKGRVPEALIDDAVRRILRVKQRFAATETTNMDRDALTPFEVEHVALAREAARKSFVLLKNDAKLLPLQRAALKKLAVIGPFADAKNIGDLGSSLVHPRYVVTPLAALRAKLGDGVEIVFDSGENLQRAARVAREADAVVLVVGLCAKQEGEYLPLLGRGGDRTCLRLPSVQEALIECVAQANPKLAVAIEGGSAIAISPWKNRAAAILLAWYPGMEGGTALAEVLLGEVSPSGKLPFTLPRAEQKLVDFDPKAKVTQYGYYHGYRYFDREGMQPDFAFGFGLSYTQFAYSNLHLDDMRVGREGVLNVQVDVANCGDFVGEEVVQLYTGYPQSNQERFAKELKHFARIALVSGEKKTVSFSLRIADLANYDASTKAWTVVEGEYAIYVGGSSRKQDLLTAIFTVTRDI